MTTPPDIIELHIPVDDADCTAADRLHEASGLSKERIKQAMHKGAVWLTRDNHKAQRIRRNKRALQAGDELHLYYNPEVLAEAPPAADLVADVGGYSVWRKPYGMRSQGSKWGDHCTIMRWAEQHLEPERTAFTVHRLDLAANGLIIVAHSKTITTALGKLFQNRTIDKRYRAIVRGDFSTQKSPLRIELPINDKTAASVVSLVEVNESRTQSLVEVLIETGRKHQIRRHLADSGLPIVGDRMYGQGEQDGVDLQLTAYSLAFECPVNHEPVEYQLPEKWLPSLTPDRD